MSDVSAFALVVFSLILYGVSCYILGVRIGYRRAELESKIEKLRTVMNYKDDTHG